MVKQRLFLGSVAFGISFGISFLTSRNLGTAIASGVTTTVAAVAASVVVDRQHERHAQLRIADLKNHIQALQQRRAEVYQSYVQLEAEKEQLAASLNTLAFQAAQPFGQPTMTGFVPKILPASRLPQPHRPLSWDLAAPTTPHPAAAQPSPRLYELPTEIPASGSGAPSQPAWARSETEISPQISPQILSDAAAAKQRIETSLMALQAELKQIKGQITDHRQTREKLSRDVANVREEKRQLEATAKALKGEVQDLEACRVELEQFLSDAEAKKQELETGSHPLQEVLKALQTQVELLQAELHDLEAQILDRRTQKEQLEQQLALFSVTSAASEGLLPPPVSPELPILNGKNGKNGGASNGTHGNSHAETHAKKAIAAATPAKHSVTIPKSARPLKAGTAPVSATAVLPEPIVADKPSSELPQEWTELMVQLPDYELRVLKVIVEQNHPAAVLKQIAEENLTMPELLIDSINERALDTIGDLLIDASSGAGSAAIVREHLKTVKKLLKTYEYLVN